MLRVIFAHSLDFAMEMWQRAVQLKQPVANPELSFVHVPNRSAFLMGGYRSDRGAARARARKQFMGDAPGAASEW